MTAFIIHYLQTQRKNAHNVDSAQFVTEQRGHRQNA